MISNRKMKKDDFILYSERIYFIVNVDTNVDMILDRKRMEIASRKIKPI